MSKMSAELPTIPDAEVNSRLERLERQLEHARQARDNYIEFLKQNQHDTTVQQNKKSQPLPVQRPSLMRRLETGQYFWDNQNQSESYSLDPLPKDDPIPSGMVLNSDLSSMTKRLREIGASIRNLRDYRLSIPSDEYFRSIRPHLQSSPGFSSYYGDPQKADLPSLAEIRSRILTMQFSVEKRTREVINQRLEVFQPVKLVSSAELIEETANPPAWLRQKDLGEELKSSVKIESKLNEAPFSVQPAAKQESQQMNIPTIRKEQQPEAKIEPLISSTRQIVFSSNTITNPLEAPKTEKSGSTKEEYRKMLDILRPPKQVEVSSSEESDTAPKKTQPGHSQTSVALSTTKTEVLQAPKPLPSFLLQASSNLFPPPPPQQKTTLSQALGKSSPLEESDDSDFFK